MFEPAADASARAAHSADDHLVRLPSIRFLASRAGGHLVEAVIVPALAFYAVLSLVDLRWALVAALLWSYAAIAARIARRARMSGVLILSAGLLTMRTAVAIAANSAFLYFAQPSLANFAVAALLLASLIPNRPLTRRLADDFCVLPARLLRRPRCARFFTRLTLLWGFVCAANGAATLILLLHTSIGGFLVLRPVVSYGLVAAAVALSCAWFRTVMRSEGLVIVFGDRHLPRPPGTTP